MRQDRDTNLLPWVLSLGLLAAGAVGAVLIMAPPTPKIPRTTVAVSEVSPTAPPLPAAMSAAPRTSPYSATSAAVAPVSDGAAPAMLNNAIWQCEVNGQKIFADSPCGAGASIRSLNEINRMMPTPIVPSSPYAHDEPPYAEPYSEEIQSVPGNTLYGGRPVYWRRVPVRPMRGHHPEPRGAPRAHRM